jgi:hypothetical protein
MTHRAAFRHAQHIPNYPNYSRAWQWPPAQPAIGPAPRRGRRGALMPTLHLASGFDFTDPDR